MGIDRVVANRFKEQQRMLECEKKSHLHEGTSQQKSWAKKNDFLHPVLKDTF